MDHSTRRFIGVTRQFLALSRQLKKDLRKALSDVNDALHQQTEAIRKANKRANDEERPSREIVASINLPPSIEIHQNEPDTRADRRYKNRTLLVSAITFLAIVVYAALVYLQYREMINATGAAQQAVVEARRNRIQADKAFSATVQQFKETLAQMKSQTAATWIAAGVAQKQLGLINTRLEFFNFNITHGPGPARSTTLHFDIINNRVLEATDVERSYGDIYGKVNPTAEEIKLTMAQPFGPDPNGEIIDKEHPQHFEVSLGDSIFWFHLEKFRYHDGFGKQIELCQVIRSSGKKNYFFKHEPCPVPNAEKTKP